MTKDEWENVATKIIALIVAIVLIFLFATEFGVAGTCVNRQDGSAAVMSCEDGSYTVHHQGGRVEQWGYRNGGFPRYPGVYYPTRRMHHYHGY